MLRPNKWAFINILKAKVSTPARVADRKELDSFIDTLVGDKARDGHAGTASPAGRKSRSSSAFGTGSIGAESYDSTSGQPHSPVT